MEREEYGVKRALISNCILLDGIEQMEPVAHKMVLVDGEKITAIVEDTAPCEGYEKVNLKGGYLMPGLINPACPSGGQRQAQRRAPG